MISGRKTPTIQDVARFAQVSTATVSRALSHPETVSESARARISAAVTATGYTLNQTARSLRQRTSKTILVGLPDIGNSFFSSILDAIEREAATRGYGVLVANRFAGENGLRRLHDYFRSNRADGLLLLDGSLPLDDLLSLGGPTRAPIVLACEDIPKWPFHTVNTDNRYAGEMATRHLIGLGHQRIGHILGAAGNMISLEREAGFRAALASAGLPIRQDWIFPGNFQMEWGVRASERFLALAERPTAVFAANDESAIGFLSGLRRHGVDCPRDISVIGFDDLEVTRHLQPPLTTMRQPTEALGRIAAAALIDLIEGEPQARVPLRLTLSSEMIVRGSTASPSVGASTPPCPGRGLTARKQGSSL